METSSFFLSSDFASPLSKRVRNCPRQRFCNALIWSSYIALCLLWLCFIANTVFREALSSTCAVCKRTFMFWSFVRYFSAIFAFFCCHSFFHIPSLSFKSFSLLSLCESATVATFLSSSGDRPVSSCCMLDTWARCVSNTFFSYSAEGDTTGLTTKLALFAPSTSCASMSRTLSWAIDSSDSRRYLSWACSNSDLSICHDDSRVSSS
mmetsp:Transcript_8804/g.16660  ORF Transcript_8804/g.16660 Transcript_8804/m.16660 type:complete len:207 (-) Transcript_8804:16339-16959(-)